MEDDAPATTTKRRRGTRGGRGRKKPGTNGDAPAAIIELPRTVQTPATLESLVAHQASVLETFAKDVSVTLKSLQATLVDLQARVDSRGAAATKGRVGIFVDVPNLIYAAERRGVTIDFGRVLDYFTRDRELVRASAYAPITDDPQAKLESQRFVHHFMGHPYRIITKPLKRFADGSMKANFDIELAIDILTMSDRLDVVVLMSGDGDFRRLVELIASRGVRVEVVAFSETASSDLKAVADLYVDIGAHLDEFRVIK
ncbi:MAG TPA: NYN domain-containing protein [Dehalococcoidia bacterium]